MVSSNIDKERVQVKAVVSNAVMVYTVGHCCNSLDSNPPHIASSCNAVAMHINMCKTRR